MDRIVSYCIEGTDKNLFDGIHYIYIHIKKTSKDTHSLFFLTLSKCKHLANLEPVKWSERIYFMCYVWNEFTNRTENIKEEEKNRIETKEKKNMKR